MGFLFIKKFFKNYQIIETQKEKNILLKQIFYKDSLMLELNRNLELNINEFLLDRNDSIKHISKGLFIYVPKGMCMYCIEAKLVKFIQSFKFPYFKLTILCHHEDERSIYIFKIKNNLNIDIRSVDNENFKQYNIESLDELMFFIIDKNNNGAIALMNSRYYDSFKLLTSFLKCRY